MHILLNDIRTSFGPVRANDGITLDIPSSTTVGILGENGAGKSTLMQILSGFQGPDSGDMILDGKRVDIHSPADALALGIGMFHQDPLDFPTLSLLDDFLLGSRGCIIPDRKKALTGFRELSRRLGFELDPASRVNSLTVGERQQLEILRLLRLGARTLILDEPTTGISFPQKEVLFLTLKRLAAEGMTVLFVSHKLEGVEPLCDAVTVLLFAIPAGMAGGTLWAILASELKTFGGVNEIFGGLGLNFVATALKLWLIFGPRKRPGIASMSGTLPFPESIWIPTVTPQSLFSVLPLFFSLAAISVVFVLLRGTHFGLRLKAVGKNPRSSYILGIPTWQHMLASFAICGCLAGLAGSVQVTAVYLRFIPPISSGYGYLGLMIAMLHVKPPASLGIPFDA